jgi:protein-S-isoprenylcysteine O-methyltransferase Ste14
MPDHDEHADIPIPPPLLFGVPLVATAVALRRRPRVPLPRWVRRVLGVALIAAGFGLGGWSVWAFVKAKENPDVWTPTNAVIRNGPYAYTRNPIYLGMALIYAGVGLLANSLTTLVSLPFVAQVVERLAIEREEAYLRAKFGRRYEQYLRDVPRWR